MLPVKFGFGYNKGERKIFPPQLGNQTINRQVIQIGRRVIARRGRVTEKRGFRGRLYDPP